MSDTYYYRNNVLDLSGAVEYLEDGDIFLNGYAETKGSGRSVIHLDNKFNVLRLDDDSPLTSDSDSEDTDHVDIKPLPVTSKDAASASATGDSKKRKNKRRGKGAKASEQAISREEDSEASEIEPSEIKKKKHHHRGKGKKSVEASQNRYSEHQTARKDKFRNVKRDRKNNPQIARPRPSTFLHSETVSTSLDPDMLRGTKTGWKGVSQKLDKFHVSGKDSEIHPIPNSEEDLPEGCHEEVIRLVNEEGYKYIRNEKGSAQVLMDCNDSIYRVKPQPPQGSMYQKNVVEPMNKHLAGELKDEIDVAFAGQKSTRSHASNAQQQPDKSQCISVGNTHGQGAKQPHKTKLKKREQKVINGLKGQPFFRRYVAHVNKTVSDWFPGHTKLNYELLNRYFPKDPDDPRAQKAALDAVDILEGSPFAGFSINIGPQALAAIHRDSSNMLNSLCAIGVFGTFNGTKSAHIVLHEAKIILEVFPGDIVILLSSSITHQNIPMCKEDADKNATRHSFVHYTTGGLFQWLWDGRMLHKHVKEIPSKDKGKKRFDEIYGLLPTLSDLQEACKTGVLSDHGILDRIRSGASLLMCAN